MGKRGRTEIAEIAEPCSFGDPSSGEVISEYIGGDGDLVLSMGLTELEDWIEKGRNYCATDEDLGSLIGKCESVRELALKSAEDLEKKSSVAIGTGGDTGVGLGCNSENLSDQEINLVFGSFKAGCPALFEDCPCDGDGDAFLTSPENSVAGGGSWAVDSVPTFSHLEEFGFNPDDFLSLFDLEDWIGDGDRDSFLTSPENSAIGSGGSAEESMPCDLEGYRDDPDDFLTLEDLDVPL